MEIIGYDFGLILKEQREKLGLTQKQLGNKIGVSEGMISRYENNMSEPSFDTVRAFAAIFNVSMDYLSGTEKHKGISTAGLTEQQIEIIRELTDIICKLNNNGKSKIDGEVFEIFGKIAAELLIRKP